MNVLVTGGAGFIGSHVVDRLVSEGHETVILDDFSAGNRTFLNPAAKVIEADIRNADAVNKAFVEHKPEAVFHLAAAIELRESFKDPQAAYDVNVTGSINIINAARQNGVTKFIFASSAAVYGDNQNLPLKESEPMCPTSPYGEQKAEIERALKESGIPSIILRYSNVYGPRQGTIGEGGVVAVFCKKLATCRSLVIFGDGEQTRDFVFVSDVVGANLKALPSNLGSGLGTNQDFVIYNVATGIETNINKLASLLLSVSQKDTTIEHTQAVPQEALRSSLDSALAARELGWQPAAGLEEGLRETWQWFSKQL